MPNYGPALDDETICQECRQLDCDGRCWMSDEQRARDDEQFPIEQD